MAIAAPILSVAKPRFGRRERTEIRAHFARDVLADMKAAYFADDRPWVVGFSGGKDSTALAQFLYYMLARLPAENLSTNKGWVYLLQVPSPWGGDNRGLVMLYRNANAGGADEQHAAPYCRVRRS